MNRTHPTLHLSPEAIAALVATLRDLRGTFAVEDRVNVLGDRYFVSIDKRGGMALMELLRALESPATEER